LRWCCLQKAGAWWCLPKEGCKNCCCCCYFAKKKQSLSRIWQPEKLASEQVQEYSRALLLSSYSSPQETAFLIHQTQTPSKHGDSLFLRQRIAANSFPQARSWRPMKRSPTPTLPTRQRGRLVPGRSPTSSQSSCSGSCTYSTVSSGFDSTLGRSWNSAVISFSLLLLCFVKILAKNTGFFRPLSDRLLRRRDNPSGESFSLGCFGSWFSWLLLGQVGPMFALVLFFGAHMVHFTRNNQL